VKRFLFTCAVLVTVVIIACKQNKGDRCQIDDDCTFPLLCNKATNTCADKVGGGIDATVPDGPMDAPDAMGSGSGSGSGSAL
jgi:hypothetical protein